MKHIVLVTYGEPTSAAFTDQLVYSWRILLGLTRFPALIGEHADLVCEVEMPGEAAITDIDTPEALKAWRERSPA